MKKLLIFVLLALVASAQVDDWQTCAESIIKAEKDIVEFAATV